MLHLPLLLLLGRAVAWQHPAPPAPRGPVYPPEEETQAFWQEAGQQALQAELERQPVVSQARNVVVFLGDGMGISTMTAARVLKGQAAGLEGGEQAQLAWEAFPHLALSRTYCVDR
jgi:alkaline phosphatase